MGTPRRLCSHTSTQTTRAAYLPGILSDKRDVQGEKAGSCNRGGGETFILYTPKEGCSALSFLRLGCMLSACKFTFYNRKGNLEQKSLHREHASPACTFIMRLPSASQAQLRCDSKVSHSVNQLMHSTVHPLCRATKLVAFQEHWLR